MLCYTSEKVPAMISFLSSSSTSSATLEEPSLLSLDADKRSIEMALLERFICRFGEDAARALSAEELQRPLEDSFAASYARMHNPALAGVVDILESRHAGNLGFDKFPDKE